MQPLFGIFSDRRPSTRPHAARCLARRVRNGARRPGAELSLILLCVVLSGIGVAAFHPEAARFANYVSGSGRARGMSFFSVGGNAGFALGPALTTPLIILFGLPRPCSSVPAVIMAAVLFHELPRMLGFKPEAVESEGETVADAPEHWGPFARMIGVVTVRSFVYFGLVAFVASYYERVLDVSPALGNTALTLMLFGGAAGTLTWVPWPTGSAGARYSGLDAGAAAPSCFTLAGPALRHGAAHASSGLATVGTFGPSFWDKSTCPGVSGSRPAPMGLSIGLGGVGAPLPVSSRITPASPSRCSS